MKKIIAAAAVSVLMATPALAADGAGLYAKKCKVCHQMPGKGNSKVGPDLIAGKMLLEDFTRQVMTGSEWAGRAAPRIEGYEKKKMAAIKGLTEADIKDIYDYVHSATDGKVSNH